MRSGCSEVLTYARAEIGGWRPICYDVGGFAEQGSIKLHFLVC